jgi:hypothetical protein
MARQTNRPYTKYQIWHCWIFARDPSIQLRLSGVKYTFARIYPNVQTMDSRSCFLVPSHRDECDSEMRKKRVLLAVADFSQVFLALYRMGEKIYGLTFIIIA